MTPSGLLAVGDVAALLNTSPCRVRYLADRTARNARKTHCKNGHEFTPENTYRDQRGRSCRRCHADREAERRARLRATEQRAAA